MNLVRLRRDFRPLCDLCGRPMDAVTVVMVGPAGDRCEADRFACKVENYKRQYAIEYGYYTVSGGLIVPDTGRRVPCPGCERAMALQRTKVQEKSRSWVCPVLGCDGRMQVSQSPGGIS